MLAGRNIGMFVGIFTMTATWVGGGYINGEYRKIAGYSEDACDSPSCRHGGDSVHRRAGLVPGAFRLRSQPDARYSTERLARLQCTALY